MTVEQQVDLGQQALRPSNATFPGSGPSVRGNGLPTGASNCSVSMCTNTSSTTSASRRG